MARYSIWQPMLNADLQKIPVHCNLDRLQPPSPPRPGYVSSIPTPFPFQLEVHWGLQSTLAWLQRGRADAPLFQLFNPHTNTYQAIADADFQAYKSGVRILLRMSYTVSLRTISCKTGSGHGLLSSVTELNFRNSSPDWTKADPRDVRRLLQLETHGRKQSQMDIFRSI